MAKIYIATKTDNYKSAQDLKELLEARGHTITYDWMKTVEELGSDAGTAWNAGEDFRQECAIKDREGVREAEILVVLMYPGLCGTLIEIGMALRDSDTSVMLIGPIERDSVFFALSPVEKFMNVDEVLYALRHR